MAESDLSSTDISADDTSTFLIDSTRGYRRVNGPTRRSTKGRWTPEEDKLLMDAVAKHNAKNWKKIADCIPVRADKRNGVQCQHRWLKVLNPNLNKGPWRKDEDTLLSELVTVYVEKDGKPKWSKISKHLSGRIGKQCRERWHNHLNPTIKKTPWTREEELVLVNAQTRHANKWAEISKLLPGRTENNIKNHWNCSVKKRLDEFSSIPFSGPEATFAKKDTKSPQKNFLDLSLGLIKDWSDTPSSTISFSREEEEPVLSSTELRNKAEISHQMRVWERSQLATPSSVYVSEKVETPQNSNKEELNEIRMRLRIAASTFKNTPSIISKRRSLPSSRHKQEYCTTNSPSNNEEHSVSDPLCSKSRRVERRLEFDFL